MWFFKECNKYKTNCFCAALQCQLPGPWTVSLTDVCVVFLCVSGGCCGRKETWREMLRRRIETSERAPVLFIYYLINMCVRRCMSMSAWRVRENEHWRLTQNCARASWEQPKISGYHLQMLFTFYNVPITHISLSQYKQKGLYSWYILCFVFVTSLLFKNVYLYVWYSHLETI